MKIFKKYIAALFKRKRYLFCLILLVLFFFVFGGFLVFAPQFVQVKAWDRQSEAVLNKEDNHTLSSDINNNEQNKQITQGITKVAIPFVVNEGQINNSEVKYSANLFSGTGFITEKEIVYSLIYPSEEDDDQNQKESEDFSIKKNQKGIAFKEFFIDQNNQPIKFDPQGEDRSSATINYFIGNDKNKWRSKVIAYNQVNLGQVWPNIEVRLKAYGDNFEKIFQVNPGANPESISVSLDGIDSFSQNKETGQLVLNTEIGPISMTAPVAYQEDPITLTKIFYPVEYLIKENKTYGFFISSDYNKKLPLIIDPLLASAFLGGGSEELADPVLYDEFNELIYVSGYTISSDFPTTSGVYDEAYNNGNDVFISVFSEDLTSLVSSTFLGGSGDESASALKKSDGDIYIVGETTSSDFPTTSGAYDETYNGNGDGFLSRLNSDLTSLSSSTFLGGSEYDSINEISKNGDIYVVGKTTSSDFPTTSGAYDETYNGNGDGFLSRLNSDLTSLSSSTFLGGSDNDAIKDVDLVEDFFVYVVGTTTSSDFPTTSGAYDETYNGETDGFVSTINFDMGEPNSLRESTFLGGSGEDFIMHSLMSHLSDDFYVVGFTTSSDFPTTSGAYDETYNGETDGFVAKFNFNDLSDLAISTFLGGSDDDWLVGDIGFDDYEHIFVSGSTKSSDFPTTSGAYDETYNGNDDGIITKFSSLDLNSISASTFIGGSNYDHISSGVACKLEGTEIFVLGSTTSSDFPTTSGAYDETYNGSQDGFVAKMSGDLSAPPNNNPTDITLSSSSVQENQPSGTDVGTLTTADSDLGDTHTYSLSCSSSGVDDSFFQISGNVLETNHKFNYENPENQNGDNNYEICIRTNDGNGGTYDENFTITVTDVDEDSGNEDGNDDSDDDSDSIVDEDSGNEDGNDDSDDDSDSIFLAPEIIDIDDIKDDSLRIKVKIDDANYFNQELIFQVKIKNEDEYNNNYEKFIETTNKEGETTIEIEDLEENANYSFRVRFKTEESGEYSEFSDKEFSETEPDITKKKYKPSDIEAKITPLGKIKITWQDNAKKENGYLVERKDGYDEKFRQIASLLKNSEEFTDNDVISGEIYTYQVRAFKGDKYTEYSNEAQIIIEVFISEENNKPGKESKNNEESGNNEDKNGNENGNVKKIVLENEIEINEDHSGAIKNNDSALSFIVKDVIKKIKENVAGDAMTVKSLATAGAVAGAAGAASSTSIPFFFTTPKNIRFRFWRAFGLIGFIFKPVSKREWGVVFDSYTKAPVSSVVVTLIDAKTGKVKDATITDKQGRFGFLAEEGTYLFNVTKGEYKIDTSNSADSLYGRVYDSNPVTINLNTVAKINIAINIQGFFWHEYSKRIIQKYNSVFSVIKKDLFFILYIIGFIFTVAVTYFFPSWFNFVLLVIYIFLFIYQLFFNRKSFGRLVDSQTNEPIPFAVVSAYDKHNQRVAFSVSDVLGRYYLLVESGSYTIKVQGKKLGGKSFQMSYTGKIKKGIFKKNLAI